MPRGSLGSVHADLGAQPLHVRLHLLVIEPSLGTKVRLNVLPLRGLRHRPTLQSRRRTRRPTTARISFQRSECSARTTRTIDRSYRLPPEDGLALWVEDEQDANLACARRTWSQLLQVVELRAFDSIGQRPSEIRTVLLKKVDRRCNECSRFLVLVAQLPVPGVNLFEQDDDPSHPHSVTGLRERLPSKRANPTSRCSDGAHGRHAAEAGQQGSQGGSPVPADLRVSHLILLYTPFPGVIAVFSLDDYFNTHRYWGILQ